MLVSPRLVVGGGVAGAVPPPPGHIAADVIDVPPTNEQPVTASNDGRHALGVAVPAQYAQPLAATHCEHMLMVAQSGPALHCAAVFNVPNGQLPPVLEMQSPSPPAMSQKRQAALLVHEAHDEGELDVEHGSGGGAAVGAVVGIAAQLACSTNVVPSQFADFGLHWP
jgi:hypothetical protein